MLVRISIKGRILSLYWILRMGALDLEAALAKLNTIGSRKYWTYIDMIKMHILVAHISYMIACYTMIS